MDRLQLEDSGFSILLENGGSILLEEQVSGPAVIDFTYLISVDAEPRIILLPRGGQ